MVVPSEISGKFYGGHMMGLRTILLAIVIILIAGANAFSGKPLQRKVTSIAVPGLRFRVASGRIVLVNQSLSDCVNVRHGDMDAGNGFCLAINVAERTSFDYEHVRADEHLHISIASDSSMTIRRNCNSNSRVIPLLWTQDKSAHSQLEIGKAADTRHYAGENLWAMLLKMPAADRKELVHLLTILRSGWRLNETLQEITAELMVLAKKESISDRSQWQTLVKQLRADTFRERRQAANRMRNYGLAIVPYLRELDRRELDVNQRRLVAELLRDLNGQSDDDPKMVAGWLIGDARVWLQLLNHQNSSYQMLALDRLPTLLRDDIPESPQTTVEIQMQLERRTTKVADRD